MAIREMDNNTSPGVDGIPISLLKPHISIADYLDTAGQQHPPTPPNAAAVIAAKLEQLYRAVSNSGKVPTEWQTAVLVPIYKEKGDANDLSNYRPLSMPTTTCRLWSAIINKKLMHRTESVLPETMFGFRKNRSCADPIFILRHLADMHKAKLGSIFGAAFMDLSGAYDSIDRTVLFQKLHNLNVSQHTIQLLQHLYSDTKCIIKCEQGTSQPFAVYCGLRQGCPLSTTLFNLYICDLHAKLQACKYENPASPGSRRRNRRTSQPAQCGVRMKLPPVAESPDVHH